MRDAAPEESFPRLIAYKRYFTSHESEITATNQFPRVTITNLAERKIRFDERIL